MVNLYIWLRSMQPSWGGFNLRDRSAENIKLWVPRQNNRWEQKSEVFVCEESLSPPVSPFVATLLATNLRVSVNFLSWLHHRGFAVHTKRACELNERLNFRCRIRKFGQTNWLQRRKWENVSCQRKAKHFVISTIIIKIPICHVTFKQNCCH